MVTGEEVKSLAVAVVVVIARYDDRICDCATLVMASIVFAGV